MAGTFYIQLYAPHTYQRRFGTTDTEQLLRASHHYIVTRAPAVRVTRTVNVDDHRALMVYEWGGTHRNQLFKFDDPLRPRLTTLGHGSYWVLSQMRDGQRDGSTLMHGSAWAWASFKEETESPPDGKQRDWSLSHHQVLYVGKAYGRPGPSGSATRNSSARLKAHSTLQRIYEDNNGSGYDIFVTPLLTGQGMSWNDDFIDDEQPGPLFGELAALMGDKGEFHRVSLVEEALIAYFRPEYNQQLLTWGRSPTAGTKAMVKANLRVLNVTVEGWEGLADFWSTHRPLPSKAHHIRWVVNVAEESQPQFVTTNSYEEAIESALQQSVATVEASGRVMRTFGSAIPQRSPWDERLPDEQGFVDQEQG